MTTKYTYKEIWIIATPPDQPDHGTADRHDRHCFSGTCGRSRTGSPAIAGVYYLAIFMMAFGFSIGAQILIARRNGEQQYQAIGPIFYQGVYFLLSLAVVAFTLSLCFSPHILKKVISSEHIYDASISYINWRVRLSFLCRSNVSCILRYNFRPKTLTLNSVVMVLSNVVFNYILIFGKFGAPQLGIARSRHRFVTGRNGFGHLLRHLHLKRIDCKSMPLNHLPDSGRRCWNGSWTISFWTMIQNFFSLSTWSFFLFVEHLGERALAITNIIRNVSGIPFCWRSPWHLQLLRLPGE